MLNHINYVGSVNWINLMFLLVISVWWEWANDCCEQWPWKRQFIVILMKILCLKCVKYHDNTMVWNHLSFYYFSTHIFCLGRYNLLTLSSCFPIAKQLLLRRWSKNTLFNYYLISTFCITIFYYFNLRSPWIFA